MSRDATCQTPAVAEDLRALSARSTLLSLVLGAPDARMSPAELARAGTYFDIPASTVRAALTRSVAAGDLRREEGDYVLGERLVARQRHQDEAVLDAERAWSGEWELVTVVATGRPGAERAALRDRLTDLRLAELREGVWMRPANLRRPLDLAPFDGQVEILAATPRDDPRDLAERLWDLPGWARRGEELLDRLARTTSAPTRLARAAQLVRQLAADPLLPSELLPGDWPGARLRAGYAAYQRELRDAALSPG